MRYDVVIAGAGPVGLFLASELASPGCTVLVLEKATDPHSLLKRAPFGLRGIWADTIAAFDRRGLLPAITQRPAHKPGVTAPHWASQQRRPAGHFAGIQYFQDRLDTDAWPYWRPVSNETTVAVEMERLEEVLAAHAVASGVELRRGIAVDAIEQADDHVVVHAGDATFEARWLVGCDGGRSIVRKLAGFDFVGTEPEFTGYSLTVTLDDPGKLQTGRHYTATGVYTFAPPDTLTLADFDGGAMHRVSPITREHVEAMLRRIAQTDISVTSLSLAATWTDRARQASSYRNGRVLLTGDAAHVHSPLGGQGLRLGLGDALNLGWKLAATIRGDAPEGLLDSYTAERHPVGAQVLDWSRAQVALMRPSPGSRALAAIVGDLIETRDGASYFAGRQWGAFQRYDLGDAHPLVGRNAPDIALADGTRLGDLLTASAGALLDFDDNAAIGDIAAPWRDRVRYVTGDAHDRMGLAVMLVRPDGIVAWATDDASIDGLEAALARWFCARVADPQ